MVLVAVTALGLAISFEVSRLRELRHRYQTRARQHALLRKSALTTKNRQLGPLYKVRGGRIPYLARTDEEFVRWLDERARYYDDCARAHDMLRIRYERAARYPWLTVPPDPRMPH